jgi:hypothetical protein
MVPTFLTKSSTFRLFLIKSAGSETSNHLGSPKKVSQIKQLLDRRNLCRELLLRHA